MGLTDLGMGVGLRTKHFPYILKQHPPVDWFEIISENFMDSGGRPRQVLDRIAERYPIVMHGVSMSIGSVDPLDRAYLRELKSLRDRIGAVWVSDHLCWTGVHGRNTHDLLPMPYTEESLGHVVKRVKEVQDFLEAPLLLENPSSYVEFTGSTFAEYDFLAELANEADCGLLLDVNNVYVASFNHGYDPMRYLAAVPMDRVVQFHVAGHTNNGTHVVDTHIGPVIDPVWELFGDAYRRCGGAAAMLEWDAEIPSFADTWAEAKRAHQFASIASTQPPKPIKHAERRQQ
jgi:hypothetical protein